MKKLLFFLLLIFSIGICAQAKKTTKVPVKKVSKKELAIKRATDYFKNEYVPVHFKDKYSYQFKGAHAVEHSLEYNMENDIMNLQREISYVDTTSANFTKDAEAKYLKMIESKKQLEDLFANLPEEVKSKTDTYSVFIECYAANSFGNKVLGTYVVDIDDEGKIEEVSKWDN